MLQGGVNAMALDYTPVVQRLYLFQDFLGPTLVMSEWNDLIAEAMQGGFK